MDIPLLLSIALPVVGVALGFLVARRTGPTVNRNRELEGEIEVLRRQSERAWEENQTLKDDLDQAREAAGGYKKKVVEHFYGTSDQLRELTLQYRAVFDHLAVGARELCPDEFAALSGGLEPPALSGDLAQGAEAELSIEVDEASESAEPDAEELAKASEVLARASEELAKAPPSAEPAAAPGAAQPTEGAERS